MLNEFLDEQKLTDSDYYNMSLLIENFGSDINLI